jgi:hypothetical protein
MRLFVCQQCHQTLEEKEAPPNGQCLLCSGALESVAVSEKDMPEFRRSGIKNMVLMTFGAPWWFIVVVVVLGIVYYVGK